MRDLRIVGTSAVAPALWGTTYLVTTELLPAHRPLLAGTLRAGPNPFSQAIEIRLHLAQSDPVRVLVLDAMGRRLETLREEPMGSGTSHSFRWEGTDTHGRRLPAGVYWVRAEVSGALEPAAASMFAQRKVILVR